MENFKKYGKRFLIILMVIIDILIILFGFLLMLIMGLISIVVVIESVYKENIPESVFIILFVYFMTFFTNKISWHFLIYKVINQYKHNRKFGGNIVDYEDK